MRHPVTPRVGRPCVCARVSAPRTLGQMGRARIALQLTSGIVAPGTRPRCGAAAAVRRAAPSASLWNRVKDASWAATRAANRRSTLPGNGRNTATLPAG